MQAARATRTLPATKTGKTSLTRFAVGDMSFCRLVGRGMWQFMRKQICEVEHGQLCVRPFRKPGDLRVLEQDSVAWKFL